MYSKEEVHKQISALVERFAEQLHCFKKQLQQNAYRQNFIDSFFKTLAKKKMCKNMERLKN